jgi:hypothetical protein
MRPRKRRSAGFSLGLDSLAEGQESGVEGQESPFAHRPECGNTPEMTLRTKGVSQTWLEQPTPLTSTVSIPTGFSGTSASSKGWRVQWELVPPGQKSEPCKLDRIRGGNEADEADRQSHLLDGE